MILLPAKKPILYRHLFQIRKRIYTMVAPLQAEISTSKEPVAFETLARRSFSPISPGSAWGKKYDCAWLHLTGPLPDGLTDPVLMLGIRGEGLVFSAAGEILDAVSTVYLLGDLPHSGGSYRPVRNVDFSSGQIDLYADIAYNGILLYDYGNAVYHGAYVATRNEAVYQYYYDFLTLLVLSASTDDSALRMTLTKALKQSYAAFQQNNVSGARAVLKTELTKPSTSDFCYSAIGHGHLDLAWLWPIRETHRKAARTYTKSLNLLADYPDYRYGTSQPQQLLWIKQEHPALYRRIQAAVAEGRMELQGAFWVECDSNLSGGESLVRQAVFGRQFLQEEFGKSAEDIRLCWLPDAFGYSGNLPQILKKSGMDWFSTIKLAWNKVNAFPYRTFRWQGIDGSTVLAHMPPEGDYNSRGAADGLRKGLKSYPEKDLQMGLLAYGAGDGGGGPGETHLEVTRREQNLRGLPKLEYASADSFFRKLEQKEIVHTHVGELYLETHQGTYTTQSKIKYYNRLLERKLHNAETLAAYTGTDCRDTLRPHWQDLLLHQFHDIIPGSSIHRVNVEAVECYQKIEQSVGNYIEALSRKLPHTSQQPAAVNLTSFARQEYLKACDGWYYADVAPYAGALLAPIDKAFPALSCTDNTISNGILTLQFDASGAITSCRDTNGKEHARSKLNQLVLYRDSYQIPYDAWDISRHYYKKAKRIFKVTSTKSYVDGPTVVRHNIYHSAKCSIDQKVILEFNSDMVRFETKVDWQQKHRMLRADFYPVHYGDTVQCEIQFGHISRPTTEHNSVERAQFEISAHKWVATQDAQGGFALANNCKYGHRAKNGLLSLNLLRAPTFPDKTADRGTHYFTYAFCPFAPGEMQKVVQAGYRLNYPLLPQTGTVFASIAATDHPAIVLETIKPAEDQSGVVLRLYESLGKPASTNIATTLPHTAVYETDLLERIQQETALQAMHFQPFELKTILLKQ